MNYRNIGQLSVTTVGLGCNNFGWHIDEAQSRRVIDAALDHGINHLDTAELYGEGASETFLGHALGDRRQDVILATKFGLGTNARPETVARSAEASLGRLRTDYIDLYYLHRPDPATPIADTLGAMSRLVEAGKVREIACSGFTAAQLREAATAKSVSYFAAVQNEYSLLHRDPETNGVLDASGELGLAFVPYFPLKSGLLTGKYRRGKTAPAGSRLGGKTGSKFAAKGNELLTEANLDKVERLATFAEDHGHTLLDLAFAYLLAHGTVASVIAGATKESQIVGNIAAAEWAMQEEELAALRPLLGAL